MIKLIYLVIRKIRSALAHCVVLARRIYGYGSALGNPNVTIGSNCCFGRSVSLKATDGGQILIGSNVVLGDFVQIVAQAGSVRIENGVFIGSGSVIVCKDNIFIGEDTLVAEYAVIRDQDHRIATKPLSRSGFHTNPIHIGRDVWIGCKASILRGAIVGDRCVIGAHALVKSHIPNDMLAVGIPAHAVRRLESDQ